MRCLCGFQAPESARGPILAERHADDSRHDTGVLLSDLWDLIAVHLPVQGVVTLSPRIKQLIWDALRKTPTIARNLEVLLPPDGHDHTAGRVRATDMTPSPPTYPSFETVQLAEAAGTVIRVRCCFIPMH